MNQSKAKQSTIYFDESIHKALKLKAVGTDRSISDIVNEAVKTLLSEDQKNIMAFEAQDYMPVVSYEELLNSLKSEGKI